MNLMDVAEVSARTNIPMGEVREYRDRYLMYIPSVRVGRDVRFPEEALAMFRAIDGFVRVGASPEAIESELSAVLPVTVICAEPFKESSSDSAATAPSAPSVSRGPSPAAAARSAFEGEFSALRTLIESLEADMRAAARNEQRMQGQLLNAVETAVMSLAHEVTSLQQVISREMASMHSDVQQAVNQIRDEQHRGMKAIREELASQQERHRRELAGLSNVVGSEIDALRFDLQRVQSRAHGGSAELDVLQPPSDQRNYDDDLPRWSRGSARSAGSRR